MWGGGCGGLDLVNLFYYESKFKIKKDLFFFFFWGGGAAGGGGTCKCTSYGPDKLNL